MKKVVLYIAMSLDGFIADQDGGVSWLSGDGSDNENAGSYPEFIETIDTVILGYKTYHQIVTELSPNAWVYEDKTSYVITHQKLENTDKIIFTDKDLTKLVMELKSKSGKGNIWICGGAGIVNQLLKNDLIDEFQVSIIPTIRGKGIPLFSSDGKECKLKLMSTRSYNGITDLVYRRRQD